MRRLHVLFHFCAYYIAWLACMLLAANDHCWWACTIVLLLVSLQLIWQARVAKDTQYLYFLILLLTMVGFISDTLYLRAHLITFNANPFSPYVSPPWMLTIWISFAVIFFSTLKSLFQRYLALSFLSFLGFSFAYYMGCYMRAATFPHGNMTCLVIGITWALLLPLCMFFYNRLVTPHA